MTTGTAAAVVSARPVRVEELRRAWHAVQNGSFAGPHAPRWHPAEAVLPVLSATPQLGATTLALVLATAAADRDHGWVRVIECTHRHASGLAAAATAEHGHSQSGWVRGRREQVWIERPGPDHGPGLDRLPIPDPPPMQETVTSVAAPVSPAAAPPDREPQRPHVSEETGTKSPVGLSVLDVGARLPLMPDPTGWVRPVVLDCPAVVVLATATVPSLRSLEATLTLLPDTRVVPVLTGSPLRRWPAAVRATIGPRTRQLLTGHDPVVVPHDKELAVRGLDTRPLPGPLLNAAALLLAGIHDTTHLEGHP